MEAKITNLVLDYFAGFAKKDIQQVSRNFSEHIVLSDWNGQWESRESVKNAIRNIFNDVDSIIIVPTCINVNLQGNTAVATCSIEILLNSKESIKVVDLIHFYNDALSGWLINKIDAYKQ